MRSFKTLAAFGLLLLYGCTPDPIAKAVYDTPAGNRELLAYVPPEIGNTNDLTEVAKVNIVFCRWGGDKKLRNVLLHCNFDTAPQKQLSERMPR